jgi:protocatechuate 3,4-dioxygenase, beta subunit
MRKIFTLCSLAFLSISMSMQAQTKARPKVGGPCEGCNLLFLGIPKAMNSVDTSAAWDEKGGNKILIKGIVYQQDGKTPASNVVVYYYHTDTKGNYTPNASVPKGAERHGYLRGWVKSDQNGHYAIYTIRPASYPGTDILAHIHVTIKEPKLKEPYYIDEFLFDDDPFMTPERREGHKNRGGNGILKLVKNGNGLWVAKHDIILGLNIPNYPQ